ncbi:MAG: hypothetical protein WAZ34_12905 [Rhodocyclaceae bacterium]
MTAADFSALDGVGLNRQAIFDLDALPVAMASALRSRFDPAQRYRQLILIGHAGSVLWDSVKKSAERSAIASENPIDDFSVGAVERWFAAQSPGRVRQIIYPGDLPVGLQALGKLAGWHHESPFRVGVSAQWGSWSAYRVVLLADTDFEPSLPEAGESPCACCADQICIASCPAGALAGGGFALDRCIAYRREPASRCAATCIARVSCPVGAEHRYSEEQLRHSYSISLKMIERYC